jgi:hypothetical protein
LRADIVFSLHHEPTTSIVRITTQEPINRSEGYWIFLKLNATAEQ